jgi:hypothetical protein
LSIDKDIGSERKLVEHITTNFTDIFKEDNEKSITNDTLGKVKWNIFEYEKIRLLYISEVQ